MDCLSCDTLELGGEEMHLFEYNINIYGQNLKVELLDSGDSVYYGAWVHLCMLT